MIYRVFSKNHMPALCSSWDVAHSVRQDRDDTAFMEEDYDATELCLDMGGTLWGSAEKINIRLGDDIPDFTFWAHQLNQVYDQVKCNWNLIESTDYIKLYGYLLSVCLSPQEGALVHRSMVNNYDMYQIIEEGSRLKWNR